VKRRVMWLLLSVVASAAAILSFSSLTSLAVLCGFSDRLGWLLPVVVDAGAAAGCLVWLGSDSTERALTFARSLTWTLLASSVAGNAVVHYLAAYHLAPPWWLVVAVSAVAPAVLGSVVHLGMLVGRTEPSPAAGQLRSIEPDDEPDELLDQARRILAANEGMYGRGRLAEALNVSEHRARKVLEQLSTNGNGR
jgi:hypothetical protein